MELVCTVVWIWDTANVSVITVLPLCDPSRLYLERQKNYFHIHSVACTGTEVHLAACPLEFRKPNTTLSCEGGMAAVVSCMPGPLFMQNSGLKKKLKTSVK